jgi:hypothetical protein
MLSSSVLLPGAGQYHVQLFFAELILKPPLAHVFDLDINGLPALRCFDIWQQAGGGGSHGLHATFLARARTRSQWLGGPEGHQQGHLS